MTGNRIIVHQAGAEELVKDYPSPSAAVEAFAKADRYFTETGKQGTIELLNKAGQQLAKREYPQATTEPCHTPK